MGYEYRLSGINGMEWNTGMTSDLIMSRLTQLRLRARVNSHITIQNRFVRQFIRTPRVLS